MLKKIVGIVTSDKQDKTIVITETSRRTHPLYGKQYTRSRKYSAHDEKNEAKIGDNVQIVECRPISRHKSFTLDKIVDTGHTAVELKEEESV
jgi:small subunit ribosomal protein S17